MAREESQGSYGQDVPIAIVGCGVRFPGDATSPEKFYEMLSEGRDAWTETPPSRYNVDAYWHPSTDRIGTTSARGAHYVTQDPSVFDAPFFSMTGAEAAALDPALRMMLEVVYECLEDSGVPMQSVVGSDTSVFVGTSSSEYRDLELSDIENVPLYSAVGIGVCMLSNRLSHFYDLRGSSQTIDTACSATMVAMHQACQSLRTGEARMSLVAGSQLMMGAGGNVSLTRLGFLSPDGRCYTFDERANGYSRGEGVGCLAIKRLDDAIADGDTIRAVVRATGSNQDGKTPGIVQPSAKAQSDLIRQVYRAAKLDPNDTQYFEAHGTGTTLGDPLEMNALVEAMDTKNRTEDNPMYVGSVKTNVGHLEGSAGLAGLFKAILQLEHGQIFPTLNFKKPNPRLRLDDWKLKLPLETMPWPTSGQRRISINSFGYGGTNAHCILDDAYNYLKSRGLKGMTATVPMPPGLPRSSYDSDDSAMGSETITPEPESSNQLPKLFVFSSPEQAAVDRMTTKYAEWLQRESKAIGKEDVNMSDLAYTLGQRRSEFQWRFPVVAQTADELQEALAKQTKSTRAGQAPNLLWVFTGQGAQWFAMGRELLQYQVFQESIAAAQLYFRETLKAEWDVLEELTKSETESRVNQAEFSQPLCTVVQVALVELLSAWKVLPQAVVGHSSGEIGAAFAAGALSAADAWKIAYHRGRLSASITTQVPELEGAMGMMAVGVPAKEIQDKIPGADAADPVVVACYNSPQNVTLSGNRPALQALEEKLKADNIFARQLKVDIAYHSPYMKVIADQYLDAIKDVKPLAGNKNITMLSTVTGQQIDASELGASYWVQNMCSPVRFVEGIKAAFPQQKTISRRKKREGLAIDGMLEIGPHSALQGPLRQILTEEKKVGDVFYASMLSRGKNAAITSIETAGTLWSKGLSLDLERVNNALTEAPQGKVLANLPTYSWNHSNSFWFEHKADSRRKRVGYRHDLVGARLEPHLGIRWRNWLRPKENPWLADFKIDEDIVLTPQTLLISIVEAGRQRAEERGETCNGFTISNVEFGKPVVLPDPGTDIYTDLRPVDSLEAKAANRSSTYEFDIFTDPENKPIYHCQGQLRIHYGQDAPLQQASRTKLDSSRVTDKSPEDFYSHWANEKILWGDQNQLISGLQTSTNSAKTTLKLKNTKKAMPLEYEYPHLVHPTTLNACFQGLHAAFGDSAAWKETKSLNSVFISNSFPQGDGVTLTSTSSVEYKGFGKYAGEVVVKDRSGKVQVFAQGVNMESSKAEMMKNVAPEKAPADVKKVVSNFYWKPDVAKITPEMAHMVFNERDLILSSPEKPKFPGTGSLCHNQKSAVPDVVPWKAFTAKWLELVGHKEPTQVIVESAQTADDFAPKALDVLGGKNGATPVCSKYLCTVQATTSETAAQFQPWSHFFQTKHIDLGAESNVQEPEPSTVDTFIVSDRLLSLANSDILLNNASNALKPGGSLVLSQVEGAVSEPDIEAIGIQLQRHGFDGVKFCLASDPLHSNARMLISPKPASPTLAADKVIFVLPEEVSADLKKYTSLLQEEFSKLNIAVEKISWNTLAEQISMIKGQAVINFLEAETPFVWNLNEAQYGQVKNFLLTASKGGIWINRGNRNLDPEGDPRFHATTGLLRVMRNEKDAKFTELSLSHKEPLARRLAVQHVLHCFHDIFEAESLELTPDMELGELNGVLEISRIYDEPVKNRRMEMVGKVAPPELTQLSKETRPLRLTIDDADDLDTLKFVEDIANSNDPRESELQIDVQAFGLRSMSDMKNHLGLSENALGIGAAGTVTTVGKTTSQYKTGDRVAFLAPGAYRTRAHVHEDAVLKIPESIPASAASTLVSNLLVAYYSVFELCRLRPLDSVLVTSAETDLGNLILQLSLHLGANAFLLVADEDAQSAAVANTGIAAERIFNSNSRTLSQDIRGAVGDHGMDFVFRTSPGAAADVATSAVSKLGKVFAYGKFDGQSQDFYQIERLLAQDAMLVEHLTKQANALLKQGMVKPLSAKQVFDISEMKAAFDAAANARGNPDIALQLEPDSVAPVVPGDGHSLQCRPDATYVIVGDLGGVGRWLSIQLAQRGAKHIATLSRSGAKKEEAQKTLKELADLGVDARAYCCDIGDRGSFETTLNQMNTEMPPVKGAVHAAMVLHDSYLADLPFEGWDSVTRNKIQGGLNMHSLLPTDMDFMVFISSLSVVMGQAMQSNYASGNAFLDGLAFHRRSLGMNCSVVNFGLIAGIGFVAELQSFNAQDADYEKYSIPPHEVWSVLESAMTDKIKEGVPMGPQQLTCCMSGGVIQTLTTLQTFIHLGDPKFKFINHLDRRGGSGEDDSVSKIRKGRKALESALSTADSFNAATGVVEAQMIEKVASAIPMPPEDVDPSRPMGHYGVDSLIASEVRNWAFNVVKGVLHAPEILAAPSIDELAGKLAQRSDLVPEKLKEEK